MIIDDVKITVAGGNGGDGLAVFNKQRKVFGPTGGSGGNGGNILLKGVADLGALGQFRYKKEYQADDGQNGKPQLNDGHNAKDLILSVPVGTICHNTSNGRDIEITHIDQTELVARGGRGGRGNYLFRSGINTSPKQSEKGTPGESFSLHLELKMLADVGFIGLPNVGKSSLLNELTNAQSKVANYPFTTLEPHLGAYYELILADIPGLIEGASSGKGLGIKFLRHIERTQVLFHCIAANSQHPINDYESVRKELEAHSAKLLDKEEFIFLTKSDEVAPETIESIKKEFKKRSKHIIAISLIDPESIVAVKKILNDLIQQKKGL